MDDLHKIIDEQFTAALPYCWEPIVDEQGVHCVYCVPISFTGKEKIIKRRVYASYQGDVTVSLHCKPLHPDLLQEVSHGIVVPPLMHESDVQEFLECVLKIVTNVRLLEVCIGADPRDAPGHSWKKYENAIVDQNLYREPRFSITLRSSDCQVWIKGPALRCKSCIELYIVMNDKMKLPY